MNPAPAQLAFVSSLFASKIFWVQVVSLVAMILSAAGVHVIDAPGAQEQIVGTLDALATMALRLWFPTGPVSLSAPFSTPANQNVPVGASVVHVDASKPSVEWAKENAALSGLSDAPIRFILDDAFDFVKREARRGNKYDAVVLDPPAFGRGPKGELWKIETDLPKLIDALKDILSAKPLFILINGYASGYSPLAYRNLLLPFEKLGGSVSCGEVAIEESGSNRHLPAGIWGRWEN